MLICLIVALFWLLDRLSLGGQAAAQKLRLCVLCFFFFRIEIGGFLNRRDWAIFRVFGRRCQDIAMHTQRPRGRFCIVFSSAHSRLSTRNVVCLSAMCGSCVFCRSIAYIFRNPPSVHRMGNTQSAIRGLLSRLQSWKDQDRRVI